MPKPLLLSTDRRRGGRVSGASKGRLSTSKAGASLSLPLPHSVTATRVLHFCLGTIHKCRHANFSGFWTPSPPLSRIHATYQYCLSRLGYPPPPLQSVTSFMDGPKWQPRTRTELPSDKLKISKIDFTHTGGRLTVSFRKPLLTHPD